MHQDVSFLGFPLTARSINSGLPDCGKFDDDPSEIENSSNLFTVALDTQRCHFFSRYCDCSSYYDRLVPRTVCWGAMGGAGGALLPQRPCCSGPAVSTLAHLPRRGFIPSHPWAPHQGHTRSGQRGGPYSTSPCQV